MSYLKKIKRKVTNVYKYDLEKPGSKGQLACESKYFYDKNGLLGKTDFYWAEKGKLKLAERHIYEHDAQGSLKRFKCFDAEGRLTEEGSYYKDRRKAFRKKAEIITFKGTEPGKLIITKDYSESGNVKRERFENEKGAFDLHLYTYDNKNRITGETLRSSKKFNEYQCRYIYREKDGIEIEYSGGTRHIKTMRRASDGTKQELVNIYSSDGHLIEIIIRRFDLFGSEVYKKHSRFEYNYNGVIEIPFDLTLTKYEYY